MAEARRADIFEWAQGQRIYEITERIKRAQAWPRGPKHGRGKEGRHIRVGPGPENVFDYRKDREGPSMAKRGPKHGQGKEGRHIRVGPGPENVCDYRKDREGPSMAKRGPKHGRGKEGRHNRVGPGPENVCDYRKDREGPSMAKRGPKHGRGKEGRHNRVGPGPENVCDYRKDREGPGMVKAKTAEVIEWAQGQRIYEITERIERAQAWPRQGGPTYSRSRGHKYGRGKEGRHNRLGPGPENLFDNRKAREGPGMVKARTAEDDQNDREGPSMAEARRAEVIEGVQGELIYEMTEVIESALYSPWIQGPRLSGGPISENYWQDDLQDDRGGLGPAVSWGRGAEIQGGGLLGKDYWMVRYTRIMDYRPDVIIDCD
ncbi:hypothetical protein EV363DRAFT_1301776 [Boletus edulis]|nr:hypothetical protein EV363DRAFT_1301776 [Boletus edulis]